MEKTMENDMETWIIQGLKFKEIYIYIYTYIQLFTPKQALAACSLQVQRHQIAQGFLLRESWVIQNQDTPTLGWTWMM